MKSLAELSVAEINRKIKLFFAKYSIPSSKYLITTIKYYML